MSIKADDIKVTGEGDDMIEIELVQMPNKFSPIRKGCDYIVEEEFKADDERNASYGKNMPNTETPNHEDFEEATSPNQEEVTRGKAEMSARILREQIKFFILIYIGYVGIHLFREFWAMSKKSLILEA